MLTRVLMGSTDAVGYCQGAVEIMFGKLLYHRILAWLDDVRGYAIDYKEFFKILEEVLKICAKYGLKRHPQKYSLFQKSAKWCGKEVSNSGVQHCPERIFGLVNM